VRSRSTSAASVAKAAWGGVGAGERVAGAALNARLVVDVSGQPGEPADLLHRLGEAHVIAPGAGESEGGHAHQDRLR
jgi:hypothetical protein